MAKLHFNYSTMNAGKSTVLLQAAHNYAERGMGTLLLTAAIDDRAGEGVIASRIGLSMPATAFGPRDDLFELTERRMSGAPTGAGAGDDANGGPLACVLVDEAQFLTKRQVWQLARVVDAMGVPVMAFGLRTDFMGELFEGSAALLAIADELREVRTICHCGSKATMVVRLDAKGRVLAEGAQVEIGGNERYVPLCRRHWSEAIEGASEQGSLVFEGAGAG